jgi:hypothetical protein
MKIKHETAGVAPQTIQELAEREGWTLIVTHNHLLSCFQASFEDVEVSRDSQLLVGEWGGGMNEAEAISEYAKKISNQKLVHNASGALRKEVHTGVVTVDKDALERECQASC